MKLENFTLAIVASIVIGILQTTLLVYCWVYIGIYSPVPHWLAGLGLHGASYRVVLFAFDFVTSVVLCLPAAFALSRLRPRRLPIYLVAAVVPGFVWQYSLVFQHPSAFRDFGQFIPGIVSALLMLPVAALVVRYVSKPTHA